MNHTELEKYIQKWVVVDDHLTVLQEKVQSLRGWKKKLANEIVRMLDEKKWSNKILEIPDGEITVCEKREYSSLSYTYIKECLSELIPDKTQVQFVMNYLRKNRKVKTVTGLKRIHWEDQDDQYDQDDEDEGEDQEDEGEDQEDEGEDDQEGDDQEDEGEEEATTITK